MKQFWWHILLHQYVQKNLLGTHKEKHNVLPICLYKRLFCSVRGSHKTAFWETLYQMMFNICSRELMSPWYSGRHAYKCLFQIEPLSFYPLTHLTFAAAIALARFIFYAHANSMKRVGLKATIQIPIQGGGRHRRNKRGTMQITEFTRSRCYVKSLCIGPRPPRTKRVTPCNVYY